MLKLAHEQTNLSPTLYFTSTNDSAKPTGLTQFKCNLCDLNCTSEDDLKKHVNSSHKNPDEPTISVIPHEPNVLKSVTEALLQEDSDQPSADNVEPALEENVTKDNETQDDTNLSVVNNKQITPVNCPLCDLEANDVEYLMTHIKNIHATDKNKTESGAFKSINCSFCDKTFDTEQSKEEHMIESHSPCSCTECGKTFRSKADLETHEKLCNVTCDYCTFTGPTDEQLKEHMIEAHDTYKKLTISIIIIILSSNVLDPSLVTVSFH